MAYFLHTDLLRYKEPLRCRQCLQKGTHNFSRHLPTDSRGFHRKLALRLGIALRLHKRIDLLCTSLENDLF